MATKFISLENLSQYDGLIKNYIDTADAKAIKVVTFDSSTREIKFFKTTDTSGAAAYTVKIPDDVDISGLMSKIDGGTVGNVVTVAADGEVADGGVALSTLATKAEVEAVDGKVGTIGDLDTTAKTDLVSAINEVRNSVSAGGTAAAITIDTSTTTTGMLKSYTIKQGDNTVGTIDIPKDLVVTSGTIETNPAGQAEGTYIKLVIANQTEPLYINVGTLVDLYTAQANATQVQLTIDNMSREVSATIVAGSVTSTELAANSVTTVKIADANVTLAKLADDAKNAFDEKGAALTAQTQANAYTDGKIGTINTTIEGIDDRVEAVETAIANVATEDEISALFA